MCAGTFKSLCVLYLFFSLDQFSYESNEVDQKNVLFFFVFLMHGIHIVECEQHSP